MFLISLPTSEISNCVTSDDIIEFIAIKVISVTILIIIGR